MTPYEIVHGKQPPSITSSLLGTSKVQVVESLLHNHQLSLVALKANLVMAQNHMKQQVDQHHPK